MLNNFVMPDLYPAAPEIFLLLMSFLVLFVDLVFGATHRWMAAMLTAVTLLGCAAITLVTSDGQTGADLQRHVHRRHAGDFLKLMTYFAVLMMLIYSRQYLADRGLDKGEFYLLVLYATLGMMIMISAANLLTMYLGLELMSLSLYGLVAIDRDSALYRGGDEVFRARCAGFRPVALRHVDGLRRHRQPRTGRRGAGHLPGQFGKGRTGIRPRLHGRRRCLQAGPGAFPHVDTRMSITARRPSSPCSSALRPSLPPSPWPCACWSTDCSVWPLDWQKMLLIMAVLSIGLGNLAAIAQSNIKRMLAYSAISHMGYMVLGLMSGLVGGQLDPFTAINAYSSALYYTVAYVLMSLGAFGMVLLLSRAGYEAENLEDFKGLNKRSPWFAAMMLIMMFSMAGIPFFIGFFAKFAVLLAAVKAGYTTVAVIAVMFSLIGAFYYLRVVKLMYFDAPVDSAPITAGLDLRVLLSLNGLAVAAFGLFPDAVMLVCTTALMRSL
jgi:NADH-quinone oxidoreductase subunit N